MQAIEHNAIFSVSEYRIKESLAMLREATENATVPQLKVLHGMGLIPTGVLSYLCAIRFHTPADEASYAVLRSDVICADSHANSSADANFTGLRPETPQK